MLVLGVILLSLFIVSLARQFNPVDLALQLMGDSVTNRDFDEFADAEAMLSRALKDSVDSKLSFIY